MKQKLHLPRFIATFMLLAVSAFSWAYDFEADGIYYDINTDGTSVKVTCRNTTYNSYSGSVVIPSTVTYDGNEYSVTEIGEYAFNDSSGLTSVTIPNSVTSIGRYAFRGCSGLTSVTIPNSVTDIGSSAFSGCSGLTSVTIPNSVTSIGTYLFYNCTSLTSIVLPKGITEIGMYTFYGCSGLTSITIPSSVTSIDARAFKGCSGIEEVICHASHVPETGIYVFEDASISSATLYVPSSAIDSYKSAAPWSDFGTISPRDYNFESDGIYYIINGDGKSATVTYAVESEASYSGDIVIPSTVTYGGNEYSVTKIYRKAFYNCREMTSISIPNSVTEIGEQAFYYCSGLTSVTIPAGVKKIPNYAFYQCTGLTSVTIPNSVTSMGYYAFSYCALNEVYCFAKQLPSANATYTFYNTNLTSATLYVPSSAVDAYKAASPWSGFGTITSLACDFVADGIYYIINGDGKSVTVTYAKEYEASYSGPVVIPSTVTYDGNEYSVTTIYRNAFYNCREMTSISIPETVKYIGESAFRNCTGLTELSLGDGVTDIVDYAFRGCTGLTSFNVPKGVTSIRSYVFYGCSNLKSVTLHSDVTKVGDRAFGNCSKLKEVYSWATKVPTTASYAFQYASISSATLYVPESAVDTYKAASPWSGFGTVSSIPYDFEADGIYYKIRSDGTSVSVTYRTESYNSYSGSVVIPSAVTYDGNEYSVTEIHSHAFDQCSDLTSVTIPNSVTRIMSYAFEGCRGLTSVTLPDQLAVIGGYAFAYCTGLTSLTIPGSVTVMDGSVFAYCTGLTSLAILDGVTSIGSSSFDHCSGLTSVTIPNSVTRIRDNAFQSCSGLTSLAIGSGVTNITYRAFADCSKLKEVICLAEQVPETSSEAFYNTDIASATLFVPESALSAYKSAEPWKSFGGKYAYAYDFEADGICYKYNEDGTSVSVSPRTTDYHYTSYSGSVVIPATVTYDGKQYNVTAIGHNAFRYCTELTSVTIPDGMTTIGKSAFNDDWALTSVTIPNSVTTIADYAFYNCKGLQKVTIGSGVTSIGEYAFTYWNAIQEVYCHAKQVPETHSDAFAGGNIASASLFVPESAVAAYKAALPWSGFGTVSSIPYDFEVDGIYYKINTDGISVSVSIKTMDGNSYSGSVVIPSSVVYENQEYGVTGIRDYSFYNCTDLTSVTIPNSVTSIGKLAFYNCSALTSLTLPEGVKEIGQAAFMNCSNLISFTVPNGVTKINDFTFHYCTGLESVTIPLGVETIGNNAFSNCSSLKEVYCLTNRVPAGVNIFQNTGISSATLYATKSSFDYFRKTEPWSGFGTFELLEYDMVSDGIYYKFNPDGMTMSVTSTPNYYSGSVVIPASVTIGDNVYSVTRIGERAFCDCTGLESVDIPESVTGIDREAFYRCNRLKSVKIPEKVKYILEGAFSNCDDLESVIIPESVTYLGEYAFFGCGSLTSVTIGKNVTDIRHETFSGCSAIEEVYCLAEKVPNTYTSVFEDVDIESAVLYVPESAIDEYRNTAPWSGFGTVLALEPEYIVGDANGSGEVEIGDVTSVLTLMATPEATGYNNKAADANGDGEIEIGDVTTILTIMAEGE